MTWELGNWKELGKFLPKTRIPREIQPVLSASRSPLCIACSGGSDSMALLLLARCWWPKHPLILLHYNHRVRAISEEEERKIRGLAAQLQLPLEVGHREPTKDAIPSEEILRTDRYAFFEKMLRLHQSGFLLLGHHQDDRLETVLMRLVRGVSLEGLIAPRALQAVGFYTKVRPLLLFVKKEIQSALQACGVAYLEDATNAADGCTRNRIRHQILPPLGNLLADGHGNGGFSRSCQILSEQRDYLREHLKKRFADWDFSQTTFERSRLRSLPTVEFRYFFQIWLLHQGWKEIHFQTMDQVLAALHTKRSTSIMLDATHRLVLKERTVQLLQNSLEEMRPFHFCWQDGTLFFPNRAMLSQKRQPYSAELYDSVCHGSFPYTETVVLDAEKFVVPYVVRLWEPGDRYWPIGSPVAIRVKKLLGSRKIPLAKKRQLPVIASRDGDIAWIPGLPPAEAFRLTPFTKFCVFLFYQTD